MDGGKTLGLQIPKRTLSVLPSVPCSNGNSTWRGTAALLAMIELWIISIKLEQSQDSSAACVQWRYTRTERAVMQSKKLVVENSFRWS
jgi:hypothetical protein